MGYISNEVGGYIGGQWTYIGDDHFGQSPPSGVERPEPRFTVKRVYPSRRPVVYDRLADAQRYPRRRTGETREQAAERWASALNSAGGQA